MYQNLVADETETFSPNHNYVPKITQPNHDGFRRPRGSRTLNNNIHEISPPFSLI